MIVTTPEDQRPKTEDLSPNFPVITNTLLFGAILLTILSLFVSYAPAIPAKTWIDIGSFNPHVTEKVLI